MANYFLKCLVLVVCLTPVATACQPVGGNRIQGRDLALVDARFAALPGTLTVGFAPAPGTKRVFQAAELQGIARANGLHLAIDGDICFELALHSLRTEDVVAAMRRVLPAEAALKVVEIPGVEAPEGLLQFSLEGLEPASPANHGVQLWRGHVTYAETRQFAVLARVEVTLAYRAVVTTRDVPAGTPVSAAWLRVENRTGPLAREKFADRIEDVEGHVAKRALTAGAAIPAAILAEAPAIRRGDPVTVEVRSGPAHVQFEAIAESAASEGEMVALRNPLNGKVFKARLTAGRKALLVINGANRL